MLEVTYPEVGATTDTMTAEAVSAGGIGQISKFSACYGLVEGTPAFTGIEYEACGTAPIDGVNVVCPTDPTQQSLVCNIETEENDGGIDSGGFCCWCNVDPATVVTCDSPETCVDQSGAPLINTYEVGREQVIIEWSGDDSCGWFVSGTKRYWVCK